ncbi:type VII secretion target [Mycobacterium sp. 663a-19]|uniref:type VII secretion target n=1 Tax=Mycobacterium sp. 663a-19 TaxID=2986148 RepID=UPI002D1EFC6F|nr:type VII secretion target [Mycobacterium sp. 663a-19]MEB3983011.1 type VII secretion target [Mycobacterium sp. 663a-19]
MRFDSRIGVDVAAVHRVADQLRGAAELVDAALNDHLAGPAFSGATAGRAHTARGDALRAQLDQLVAQLSQWSRASVAIAVALRSGAERYADAEMYAAARIA